MADATAIINRLGQQIAQLTIDRAALEVELGETQMHLNEARRILDALEVDASALQGPEE